MTAMTSLLLTRTPRTEDSKRFRLIASLVRERPRRSIGNRSERSVVLEAENTCGRLRCAVLGRADRPRQGNRRNSPSDEERPSVREKEDQRRVELIVAEPEPLDRGEHRGGDCAEHDGGDDRP